MAQMPLQSRPAAQAQAGLAPAVLDLAEETLLQELFGRYCSHGKDRAPTPAYSPTAVRGFGPARRGSAVPMLQEDVARFRSRLRKEASRGSFVFSAFASHALEAFVYELASVEFGDEQNQMNRHPSHIPLKRLETVLLDDVEVPQELD